MKPTRPKHPTSTAGCQGWRPGCRCPSRSRWRSEHRSTAIHGSGPIDGETAAPERIDNVDEFARRLAEFLVALQAIDASDGPPAGPHNFHRGGALAVYDGEVRAAIDKLAAKIDSAAVRDVWEAALASTWRGRGRWVHGDIAAGNLLVVAGALAAVIDFGQLGMGDPACDLAIAWTLFSGSSRQVFRGALALDAETWARGRGWALWKALIVAAGITSAGNSAEAKQCWHVIDEVLGDHAGGGR
jgi:aminoglycoside phosphotransferase (APT) family kinase protein